MPPNPAQKVPQVGHRDPPGPHSRDVNSCPRERQGGYKQIPPDLPGGYRPPGRLLLQLQRLSSVAGFRLTPKGRWLYVCMYVCGQLNRGENNIPLSPYAPDNLVSRDEFTRPVPSRVVQITLNCLRYTCTTTRDYSNNKDCGSVDSLLHKP